jgi:Pentapeptide repeats (8 copies)
MAAAGSESLPRSDSTHTLHDRYQAGERDFCDRDFSSVNLPGSCLSYANFRHAKLKQIDLSQSDLRGINFSKADLSQSNLQNADLRGASISQALLCMALLNGANLQGADLSGASLVGITQVERVDLQGANLCGADLRGVNLRGANLLGAYFDSHTQFDTNFEPHSVGLQTTVTLSIADLVTHLNQLSQCAKRYLGNGMMVKYWEASRYDSSHLTVFGLDAIGQFYANGNAADRASIQQLKWAQLWSNRFIGTCALILQDFPQIVTQNRLLLVGLRSPVAMSPDVSIDKSLALFETIT